MPSFFLPFLLIQVHGYSATAAGATFLPFTLILGVLSRWSGGLVDRFGARWPLILGPAISALGLALLALPGADGRYWSTFLLPMSVLGLGMAVTVAPLTTTVINAVPARQTGLASGINNAVASVASLLTIAVLGTVAISALNRTLDRDLVSARASSEVTLAVDSARGGFVTPLMPATLSSEDRLIVHSVIENSFIETIRLVMLIAAALALLGAISAAFTIESERRERDPGSV